MEDLIYLETVKKIPFYPPSWLFALVWPILYVLLIAGIMLHYRELTVSTAGVYYDVTTFCILINLIMNKGWSTVFFKKRMYIWAAVIIFGMLITGVLILVFVALNDIANRWVVFSFFLIYELWCFFAFVLNVTFCVIEKKTRETVEQSR